MDFDAPRASAGARRPTARPAAVVESQARPARAARPAPTAGRSKPAATAPSASKHPPKPRTPAIEAVIARCRAICAALPDVTEVEAWAEPTWRVGGKQFAMFDTYHHGSPHLSLWIPAAPGAQAALIDAEPARFWRPPYVGHRGWVAIVVDDEPPWDMIASLVAQAHQLVAPTQARPGSRRVAAR